MNLTSIGVAVVKSHRNTVLLRSSSEECHRNPKYSHEIDETGKRTLVTAFLLVVSNVIGYSLQNAVLVGLDF